MSKISCPIIRDILPLYVDDVVSDDTRHMVEEHLAHCDGCRKLAAEMQGEMVLPIENDTKPLEHFKNAWKRKKIMIAVFLLWSRCWLRCSLGLPYILRTCQQKWL